MQITFIINQKLQIELFQTLHGTATNKINNVHTTNGGRLLIYKLQQQKQPTNNSRCLSLSFTFRPIAEVIYGLHLPQYINHDHAHVYVHDMPHVCCNIIHVVFNHSSRLHL